MGCERIQDLLILRNRWFLKTVKLAEIGEDIPAESVLHQMHSISENTFVGDKYRYKGYRTQKSIIVLLFGYFLFNQRSQI